MPNIITDIVPKIIASAALHLRERVPLIGLINSDLTNQIANFGETVNIPLPPAVTEADDVIPSVIHPTPDYHTITTVPLTLNNWKHKSWTLTDKDIEDIDARENFLPMVAKVQIDSLARSVNNSILNVYHKIYNTVGTAGQTPFANDIGTVIDAWKVLSDENVQDIGRVIVLNHQAYANALKLDELRDISQSQMSDVLTSAMINEVMGFLWHKQLSMPKHTAGTITGDPTTTGVVTHGSTSINVTCDADDAIELVKGDVITFSNDTQTYAVVADVTIPNSATGTIVIHPPLRVALAGSETFSVIAAHAINLAMHRDAISIAFRMPGGSLTDQELSGNVIQTITDPETGLALRLEISRQFKMTIWDLDILWGVALTRPEQAARILG